MGDKFGKEAASERGGEKREEKRALTTPSIKRRSRIMRRECRHEGAGGARYRQPPHIQYLSFSL